MAGLSTIQGFWSIITEIDLRPLAGEALQNLQIAIVASSKNHADLLADQMRRDPSRPDLESDTPVLILDYASVSVARQSDLVILLMDGEKTVFSTEKELARALADAGRRVLAFVVLPDKPAGSTTTLPQLPWKPRYAVYGPVDDAEFLSHKFVLAVIRLLPDKVLALGRSFPLFRVPIAHYLINDTSQSNAAYSLATGLAEIVPILNIPFVVTDMIILTKNQAFMAYKLGLIFDYSTEWKDYLGEFGSVLGFGFVLRQLARTLVGLIPVIGILPKVAVSYAGTVVVGNAILQWYLTGRHISSKQISSLYSQAYLRGKNFVGRFLPRFPRRKKQALPAAQSQAQALPQPKKKAKAKRGAKQVCPQCGRTSAADAVFCQYCGYSFSSSAPSTPAP